jgi:serine/threonine-protein kinase
VQPDFVGPYTIGTPLAPGTLSWLYDGLDTRTEQRVSLKLGFEEVMINPLYAACFHAELKIMQSVKHENLLTPERREGEVLVLEPALGMDFEQWIRKQKERARSLLFLLEQLCDLVATLHSGGVVHHDLRPGVFLITNDKVLKLFDMGHAFQRDIPDVILSSGLGPQGDLQYMAPELIQGLRGDPRSDIYSLGIMLHLLYTKSLPFPHKKASISNWLNMKKEVPSPRAFKESIAGDIENIIVKAMAWDVENRYQWVEDLWRKCNKQGRTENYIVMLYLPHG